MRKTKEKRGITLIALIITIIVLLILAGVTISMVVGDNGVLTQAQNAKIKTEKAKDEELRGLTAAEAGANLEGTTFTGTLTVKQEDGTEKSEEREVPIPAGFAVSQVEGENKIDDGLVVIDKNGNEFVWIPCGTKKEDGTYDTAQYEGAKDYVKTEWSSNQTEYTNKTWTNPNETIAKNSISKYGGFYVARFEAGVPSDAQFYVSNTAGGNYIGVNGKDNISDNNRRGKAEEKNEIKDLKPVSKKGVQAWNFINQSNARMVSENMYKDNNTVDSCLISSNDWNYICGDILEDDVIENSITHGNYMDNTTTDYTSLDCLWANHPDFNTKKYADKYEKGNINSNILSLRSGTNRIELATGASDDFKIYNIYDMAGNMWEFMSETSSYWCAVRGGSFHQGYKSIVFVYGNNSQSDATVACSFRPVLYVK